MEKEILNELHEILGIVDVCTAIDPNQVQEELIPLRDRIEKLILMLHENEKDTE